MSDIALSHGATIDKYVGDAMVIFFGDPESKGVKQDARQCARMALAMQRRMAELQEIWREVGIDRPLRCRMGINTGFCTVGNFGSEHRMDYTIIGSGVNLASRLESTAKPGEILMSYETFALIREEFQCEERGEIEVRGIAYPVATYALVGDRAAAEEARSLQLQAAYRLGEDVVRRTRRCLQTSAERSGQAFKR
jgi:class 3 adenylate cyclase